MIDVCQICGEKGKLEKHHISYKNNITLTICKKCHSTLHGLKRLTKPEQHKEIKLKCKSCNYEWIYRGQSTYYATCPDCMNKVRIVETEIKEVDKDGND